MNHIKFWIKKIKQNSILCVAIGFVYLWFGTLKFFPNLSPAEDLAKRTISALTFDLVPSSISIFLLAFMEVVIGLLLIGNLLQRQTLKLTIIHIIFTFSPFILFPEESFSSPLLTPTLLGQYIGKNLIIMAALLTVLKEKSKV